MALKLKYAPRILLVLLTLFTLIFFLNASRENFQETYLYQEINTQKRIYTFDRPRNHLYTLANFYYLNNYQRGLFEDINFPILTSKNVLGYEQRNSTSIETILLAILLVNFIIDIQHQR
jgi:hypothetical protein